MATVLGEGTRPSEIGVLGRSEEAEGVRGESDAGVGVTGACKKSIGVLGFSESTTGGAGVMGQNKGVGPGVLGKSQNDYDSTQVLL